jgi:hypothetical protein
VEYAHHRGSGERSKRVAGIGLRGRFAEHGRGFGKRARVAKSSKA